MIVNPGGSGAKRSFLNGGKLRFIPPMMYYLEISACEITFCGGQFYIYPHGKTHFSPEAIIVNLQQLYILSSYKCQKYIRECEQFWMIITFYVSVLKKEQGKVRQVSVFGTIGTFNSNPDITGMKIISFCHYLYAFF